MGESERRRVICARSGVPFILEDENRSFSGSDRSLTSFLCETFLAP